MRSLLLVLAFGCGSDETGDPPMIDAQPPVYDCGYYALCKDANVYVTGPLTGDPQCPPANAQGMLVGTCDRGCASASTFCDEANACTTEVAMTRLCAP